MAGAGHTPKLSGFARAATQAATVTVAHDDAGLLAAPGSGLAAFVAFCSGSERAHLATGYTGSGMNGPDDPGQRLQDLYWKALLQLKVECEYVRRYQASLEWWVTRISVVRAGAAVGAIGTWAVVKSYPLLWGGIIALAQVADAMQAAIPLNRRHQGTSALVITLDALFITAQGEWEDIYAARIDQTGATKARLRLLQQMHDAQAKNLPTGIPRRNDLFRLAEADAAAYFKVTFGTGPIQ